MRTSHHFASPFWLLMMLVMVSAAALADDPGVAIPPTSAISDQKPGSVLFYNLYSSSATNPASENTRINITNTSSAPVAVHLFFIDGTTCSPADSALCLTANQTATISAADVDPGTMGYIIAVAVDPLTGCPISFNHLIGDEYVKLASGHQANLGAEAVAALFPDGSLLPTCDATSSTATINFDGVSFNQLPRTLAASSIPSAAEGNSTLLVINNPSGDLLAGANSIGSIFGILFNDAENAFSFTLSSSQCQIKGVLSNSFPRTTPRFNTVVPAGRTGWLKIWSPSQSPLLGAVINFNPLAAVLPSAFNQGHNLHKLTLSTDANAITVPVFPANNC